MKKIFPGVYKLKGRIATENSSPGFRVYDEKLIKEKGREYRIWDPYRSKLAAAILGGLKEFPFRRDSNILYLGASSGTTPSHLSDICSSGMIYCLEYSKRMMRNLSQVCEKKTNMIPLLGDARYPETYIHNLATINIIYQDVAQPNQAEIMLRNSERFSPKYALLVIKSRSINAVKNPKKVFREEIDKLKKRFDVMQVLDLRPYDKDHVMVSLKTKQFRLE
ncbi:MAG: fibrillarin-like rRNA/tRNA 2'-O-methyltransferase [Candidatus Altiarchaeota archaeon]|nr:fibrillarin-like rRNA/tRNA 2'-O-methyltransferase [Candidatus Altiarchaeota archaeon]